MIRGDRPGGNGGVDPIELDRTAGRLDAAALEAGVAAGEQIHLGASTAGLELYTTYSCCCSDDGSAGAVRTNEDLASAAGSDGLGLNQTTTGDQERRTDRRDKGDGSTSTGASGAGLHQAIVLQHHFGSFEGDPTTAA